MQVSVEATSNLERRLTIAVPAQEVDAKVNAKLAEVAKTAKINGFRKGKVPLKVISKQFGHAARQEVAGDLINASYLEALEKESVKPAGYPKIEVNSLEAGKDLEYVAVVEVYPEVTVGEFDGFSFERLTAEIEDTDIDASIQALREQRATFESVERAAAEGDRVTIDFVGTKDGEAFQGGTGSDFKLELGSNSMIPGFEDGIVGMSAGDEKTLSLTFPEDYQVEELKGAAAEFKVTVKTVEAKQLPEVDAEFMQHFGCDSEEKFRTDIKANMERELKRAISGRFKASVMDKLLDAHEVELPKALVASEIETLREQMMQQFGGMQQNKDLDLKALLPDNIFEEQAGRRVALGLIIGAVVKKFDIKADPDKVRAYIEENAASYEKPEEVVNYYYQNQELLNGIQSVVLEDMVVDKIVEQSSVSEKSVSYQEAISTNQE